MNNNLEKLLTISGELIEQYNKEAADLDAMWEEIDELRAYKHSVDGDAEEHARFKKEVEELAIKFGAENANLKTRLQLETEKSNSLEEQIIFDSNGRKALHAQIEKKDLEINRLHAVTLKQDDRIADEVLFISELRDQVYALKEQLALSESNTVSKDVEEQLATLQKGYDEKEQELAMLKIEFRKSIELKNDYADALDKQNDIVVKQGERLDAMQKKNETVISLAKKNVAAQDDYLRKVRAENKKLSDQSKKVEDLKTKLSDKNKAASALEGLLKNERRTTQGLRMRLETQKIGIWQGTKERVIPYLNGDVIQRKDLVNDTNVSVAAWWQHECGLQILCAYDKVSDSVYMCNPSNEAGNMRVPTALAESKMLDHFRELDKKGKKNNG